MTSKCIYLSTFIVSPASTAITFTFFSLANFKNFVQFSYSSACLPITTVSTFKFSKTANNPPQWSFSTVYAQKWYIYKKRNSFYTISSFLSKFQIIFNNYLSFYCIFSWVKKFLILFIILVNIFSSLYSIIWTFSSFISSTDSSLAIALFLNILSGLYFSLNSLSILSNSCLSFSSNFCFSSAPHK